MYFKNFVIYVIVFIFCGNSVDFGGCIKTLKQEKQLMKEKKRKKNKFVLIVIIMQLPQERVVLVP